MTAPVDMDSSYTRRFTLPTGSCFAPAAWCSSVVTGKSHSCSRCPPSPSGWSRFALAPVTKPSSDVDMYGTVADIAPVAVQELVAAAFASASWT